MLLISVREFFLPYALFHGKLYVDCEKMSFTRIEMNLDMQNKSKAIAAILHQKPFGLRFKPQELSFLITYKTIDGRTYLNYIRNDVRFKCDWKRRLFLYELCSNLRNGGDRPEEEPVRDNSAE